MTDSSEFYPVDCALFWANDSFDTVRKGDDTIQQANGFLLVLNRKIVIYGFTVKTFPGLLHSSTALRIRDSFSPTGHWACSSPYKM